MKKVLCFVLTVIMITGILAGCGGNKIASEVYDPTIKVGDTGGLKMPLTKENMTVEWQVISSFPEDAESWFIKKLRGITGVDVKLHIISASTVNEKLQALLASGSKMPDIIGSMTSEDQARDIAVQGAFASVEDYIDVLPNFKKTFVDNKENNWIFDAYKAEDGKLYGFYGFDWQRDINHTMMYRKDIFDKHGIKMWNNNDEFYSALKQLKENYPDSYPYTSKYTDQIFAKWSPGWGIKAHEPYYDETQKVWKYTDTDLKYKDMLDFMKKLYDEGLMDPEFLTNTQAVWTQRMTTGQSFVTFDWIDRMISFKDQTKESIPEYDLRFANPVGPNQTYAEVNQLCWARYVKKQDPEREKVCFQLCDFLLSPFGKELMGMGIEGETYTIDENGMAEYIGFEEKPSVGELHQKYGFHIEGMYLGFDRREAYFNFAPQLKEAQDFVADKNNLDPLDPVLSFTSDETKKINDLKISLQKSGKEFSFKYIFGEASWDEWINKAKSLGSEDITKIYNDAQKRLNSK